MYIQSNLFKNSLVLIGVPDYPLNYKIDILV